MELINQPTLTPSLLQRAEISYFCHQSASSSSSRLGHTFAYRINKLTLFPRHGDFHFCHHVIIVSKTFAKRIFPRCRALLSGRDVT